MSIELNLLQTTALALLMYCLGRFLVTRIAFLKKFCIPAPVVGGLIFALAHLALYQSGILALSFDKTAGDFFMILVFTGVGYTASLRLLAKGGVKVLVFLSLAAVMIFLQNVLSAGLATVLDFEDLRLSLAMGSLPMVGGHGTAGSFGPVLE